MQAQEFGLRDALRAAQRKADSALRDNLDTPRALEAVQDAVKAANLYRAEREKGAGSAGAPRSTRIRVVQAGACAVNWALWHVMVKLHCNLYTYTCGSWLPATKKAAPAP